MNRPGWEPEAGSLRASGWDLQQPCLGTAAQSWGATHTSERAQDMALTTVPPSPASCRPASLANCPGLRREPSMQGLQVPQEALLVIQHLGCFPVWLLHTMPRRTFWNVSPSKTGLKSHLGDPTEEL